MQYLDLRASKTLATRARGIIDCASLTEQKLDLSTQLIAWCCYNSKGGLASLCQHCVYLIMADKQISTSFVRYSYPSIFVCIQPALSCVAQCLRVSGRTNMKSVWYRFIETSMTFAMSSVSLCRDPFQPLMDVSVQISWLMEVKWLNDPGGILFCQDDSSLRFLELDAQHRAPADRLPKALVVWW